MEATTFISPLTNNQFFSVCHYITTLGIILNNNNLLSTPAENDTVPVLNAFFEYLNKSNNESVAKIHLFKEMRSKINVSDYEELKNFENVNKLYQYIINMGLFAHYGNIADYVSNIYQDNNDKSFSNQQEILFHDFSNNLTIKNICSLRKESKNLNSFAIKRIFVEYVLPVFTEIWKERKNLSVQRNDLKIVKRFKRQESSPEDSDIDVVGLDEDPPKVEDPIRNFRLEFLLKLKVNGLTILNQEKNLFCNIVTSIAIEQVRDGLNYPLELWLLEITTNVTNVNHLINLKGSSFFVNDFMLVTTNPSGQVPPKIWKPYTQSDETNVLYHIVSESLHGFVALHEFNIHNLYILLPQVEFTVTDARYQEIENKLVLIVDLKRNDLSSDRWNTIINNIKHRKLSNTRNSRRMNAIQRAAELISSKVPMKTFTEAVNMLKSYILNVDAINFYSLTYNHLAQNYMQHMRIMDFYSPWKINNSKYINDVLYKSKFYFQHNNDQYYWKLKTLFNSKSSSIFDYYYNTYKTNLNYLQNKLRFEDFYRISYFLNKTQVGRLVSDLRVALLRVALRQCDEELNEEPIVLYQAFYVTDSSKNIYHYTGMSVTLRLREPCSRNRNLLLSNVLNDTSSTGIVIFYKIHLKNRRGVADIYQFSRSEIKSHFLSIDEKYERIEKVKETIRNQKVIFMTVKPIEEKTKEEKIIDIVKELNDIYVNGQKYYIED
ncbi:uncharacterized protein LOC122512674 isoform X2 [Leptopilina heterotoma]|uniref:uncharacterized protein LOC122512674 isoform X2 n=1 Tax=Leptopilina heterotoma TaxID=63436 RepID=UPI001CA971BF|nr:uncharacterized protein LOC122512674 isoform X2 [Leptopilina heterotoma]